jgi:hypothetical protein
MERAPLEISASICTLFLMEPPWMLVHLVGSHGRLEVPLNPQ